MADAATSADIVIGSDREFEAARLDPTDLVAQGATQVLLKHGPAGASWLTRDGAP